MQQPKRFQAPTLAEAYEQVRAELGESAVILSTRKAFAPGLFGQPGRLFVEVVARVPEPASESRRPTADQDQVAHDLVRAVAEAAAAAPTAVPAAVMPAPAEAAAPAPVVPTPMSDAFSRQMDQMRGMLEQLLADRIELRADAASPAVRAVRERLLRTGLPASLAATLLGEADTRLDEQALLANAERRLAGKLPPAATVAASRGRTIFLVGPAGAGKTTMAVRLALELQRAQGLHVVIAGTDVNRAGAPQQLLAFGAATGLEVRLCYAPGELEELLADAEVDAVIVDTPGHNGLRRDRMAELDAFLQSARQRTVLLAVPATMKASDLSETVAAYGALGVDGLVLTGCDETAHFGALAGVAVESAIGVAFTTHSDQVSDAPASGDNSMLAAAVVAARWGATPTMTAALPVTPARTRRLAKAG